MSDVSYSVELGVNVPGQRLCVGEIGPFRTATQALIESAALIGKALPQVEERPDFCSFSETAIAQQHSAAITVPPGARIAGFTINRYHDDAGTDPNWFINGEGRAFETEARERDETVDGAGGFLEYGRCDTCGQPCNAGGCTADPRHEAALEPRRGDGKCDICGGPCDAGGCSVETTIAYATGNSTVKPDGWDRGQGLRGKPPT